jgi:hypothetical protein
VFFASLLGKLFFFTPSLELESPVLILGKKGLIFSFLEQILEVRDRMWSITCMASKHQFSLADEVNSQWHDV